jgi:hypothetical protein
LGWFITLGCFVAMTAAAIFYYDPLDWRIRDQTVAVTQADERKLAKIKEACAAKWGGIAPVKNRDGTTDYLLRGNAFTPEGNRTHHLVIRLPTKVAVDDLWEFELAPFTMYEGKTEIGCANKRNDRLLFNFDIRTHEIVPDAGQPTPKGILRVEVFAGSMTKQHWQIILDPQVTRGVHKNCLQLPGPSKNLTFFVSKDPAVDDAKARAKPNRADMPCFARESHPSFILIDDNRNYVAAGRCLKIECQSSFLGPAGNKISIIHRRESLESLSQDIETLSAFLEDHTVYFGVTK